MNFSGAANTQQQNFPLLLPAQKTHEHEYVILMKRVADVNDRSWAQDFGI